MGKKITLQKLFVRILAFTLGKRLPLQRVWNLHEFNSVQPRKLKCMLVYTERSWTLFCSLYIIWQLKKQVHRDPRLWYSECDFWTSSVNITWQFVRSADSWPHLMTYWIRIFILTGFAGGSKCTFLEALLSDIYIVAQLISDQFGKFRSWVALSVGPPEKVKRKIEDLITVQQDFLWWLKGSVLSSEVATSHRWLLEHLTGGAPEELNF